MMFDDSTRLLAPAGVPDAEIKRLLEPVGFDDWRRAHERFQALCPDERSRRALERCLPMLLVSLSDAATPDGSLINFERFVQSVEDRAGLFEYLAKHPRAVEILVKLFVGSQFLTETLLRNPAYLDELTQHKQLAEFKHRGQFIEEALAAARRTDSPSVRASFGRSGTPSGASLGEMLDGLRRYQHRELLRIGACDAFGLFDLKSATVQLSLLADSIVQVCLSLIAEEFQTDPAGFVVLAFGKLGGEELNYSSDIDLVFLCDRDAARFWPLGQRLIKALTESTREGFLYRVDMRLRPWGKSGSLVNTVDAHVGYLKQHGMLWERQALLKARPIAGDFAAGQAFLERVQPLLFDAPVEALRASVREMKERIEAELHRQGRAWGEVKSGAGSIRDIEFVTQFLQLAYGGRHPAVRSINTLDGLVRLADFGLLHADEYRHLADGYVFLRTVEHSLQLMHHKQTHSLPESRRELAWLARRLDYPGADAFLLYYERHRAAVRRIYEKYILGRAEASFAPDAAGAVRLPEPLARMEPSYARTFSEDEIARHAELLARLSPENNVEVDAVPLLSAGRSSTPAGRAASAEPRHGSAADGVELRAVGQDADGGQLRPAGSDELWQVTIVGFDHPGNLSMMCGLLFVYGFNIVGGEVFSAERAAGRWSGALLADGSDAGDAGRSATPTGRSGIPTYGSAGTATDDRKFVDVFAVRPPRDGDLPEVWARYRDDLSHLLAEVAAGRRREAQGQLAKRVAGAVRESADTSPALFPVEIGIDNESAPHATVLRIESEDTIGFLYELSNALSLAGIDITRVVIRTEGQGVHDTLHITDAAGEKITDADRQKELRAAVVLIKHFTHLLPRSPNPEQALLHFRDFLEQLFQRPDWVHELSSLERPDVLHALARLLGVSNFLWEDFLRLQHENLFPVVTDVEALSRRKSRDVLARELAAELASAGDGAGHGDGDERRRRLNAFKDREMFRTDLRHIMGLVPVPGREPGIGDGTGNEESAAPEDEEFGQFSAELTDLAEVIVEAACRICLDELQARYGRPRLDDGRACDFSVCALGKCGGRELGYASDIELMFVYEGSGMTGSGDRGGAGESITTGEFFVKLVEAFGLAIHTRQEGIFQVDLRLRPYGRAGSLAVTLETFRGYFAPDGAAWPYERQALVKLRPIAGDAEFGRRVVETRDEVVYTGEPFDVAAMRAMREKQVRQLVQAGTFNAKLSPGGLVDCEYLVQGLQITHGRQHPSVRCPNTLEAMAALANVGVLSPADEDELRRSYIFLRKLIDGLRMVRGHARDLTVPPADGEEFEFLARRLGYRSEPSQLDANVDRATACVAELLQKYLP
ncbi:MAG TPA: glutamine synthetase adenylyltransferase [Planctomycetaceae bacterium]|nr:glutamine synthetase adenylyltransferase [Planctomycetaceae bacterium]